MLAVGREPVGCERLFFVFVRNGSNTECWLREDTKVSSASEQLNKNVFSNGMQRREEGGPFWLTNK